MKHSFLLLITFLSLNIKLLAQKTNSEKDEKGNPYFTNLKKDKVKVSKKEATTFLAKNLGLDANNELKPIDEEIEDDTYNTRTKYQQYYKGVKVEHGVYYAHADKVGQVNVTNGNILSINPVGLKNRFLKHRHFNLHYNLFMPIAINGRIKKKKPC